MIIGAERMRVRLVKIHVEQVAKSVEAKFPTGRWDLVTLFTDDLGQTYYGGRALGCGLGKVGGIFHCHTVWYGSKRFSTLPEEEAVSLALLNEVVGDQCFLGFDGDGGVYPLLGEHYGEGGDWFSACTRIESELVEGGKYSRSSITPTIVYNKRNKEHRGLARACYDALLNAGYNVDTIEVVGVSSGDASFMVFYVVI